MQARLAELVCVPGLEVSSEEPVAMTSKGLGFAEKMDVITVNTADINFAMLSFKSFYKKTK